MAYSFNFIDHTADVAFEACGDTLEDLFIASAEGWKETAVEKNQVKHSTEQQVSLQENSLEELLVYFLDELNFLLNTKCWIMECVKNIQIYQNENFFRLDCILEGEKYSPGLHDIKIEIKAVTFHQMDIINENGKFKTTVVFDI